MMKGVVFGAVLALVVTSAHADRVSLAEAVEMLDGVQITDTGKIVPFDSSLTVFVSDETGGTYLLDLLVTPDQFRHVQQCPRRHQMENCRATIDAEIRMNQEGLRLLVTDIRNLQIPE